MTYGCTEMCLSGLSWAYQGQDFEMITVLNQFGIFTMALFVRREPQTQAKYGSELKVCKKKKIKKKIKIKISITSVLMQMNS